ncbi:hypothetical protein [Actinopolymorpha pittospori]|uniref:Uncharacterized protein n=1 Tax=Actinopolymorpha pittospori TaxID=648752 RepID=A0A927RFI4_9ACTN|nr:hypothetical protein [Actinopolymorpha pittospori]MBE1610245.1 hypothetical protein [Actinopolymorpha pittospori]
MGLDSQRRKRRCYLAAVCSLVGLIGVAAAGVIALGAVVEGVGKLAPEATTVQQSTRSVADHSDGDDKKNDGRSDKKKAGEAHEAGSRITNDSARRAGT